MKEKLQLLSRCLCKVGKNILCIIFLATYIVGNNINEPPIFEAGGYPIGLTLLETTKVGTQVFILKGRDPEGLAVKYGIQSTDKFEVNKQNGIMTLAKPLDREEEDTIRFRVTLEDFIPLAQQPNIVSVEAYVIVLDENDNPPQFLGAPYEVIVAENASSGTTILPTIRVTDPDLLGENIEVTCVSQPQFPDACKKFDLINVEKSQDTYIGVLVLQQPLDYKERPFYQFLLHASDGTNSNNTVVEIKVTDIQNSPPEFQGSLTGVITENDAIGTLVMVVKAKDGDRGTPRKIVYDLMTNPFDYFLLDAESGELRTAKPLNRETLHNSTGVLTLMVRAREIIDGRQSMEMNNSLSITVSEATVTIKDINDEPPTFNKKEYNIFIPENIADGTPLPYLDMTVRDPDIGYNSVFSLRLEDITGGFSVEPSLAIGTTSINLRVTNGSLDYENPNQRKFIILVIAEEVYTNPKLSSTATVTIGIIDINDNAPTFLNPSYTTLVSETARSGTPVIMITAKDRDSGCFGVAGIIYELIGKGSEHFAVDTKTGNITLAPCPTPGTAPCLDYEKRKEYFLNYKATDEDGLGRTTSVSLRINLNDVNDSSPKFQHPSYQVVIDEGAERFEPPLRVHASDDDKTSKIIYSLIEESQSEAIFKIDSNTGEISLKKRAYIGDEVCNIITLIAKANDGTFSDEAILNITMYDINDNTPVFDYDLYSVSIPEHSQIHTIIKILLATDADSGLNSELAYKIQKGAFNDFSINETIPAIFVSRKLDYDRRNSYHMEIIAFDKGSPSLTGTTTLVVNVENSNDKPPYFSPKIQRAEVTEDTSIGSVISVLQADDTDSTDFDALNFMIIEPLTAINKNGRPINEKNTSYKDFFAINQRTGEVYVNKALNRSIAAVVSFTVLVIDTSASFIQQGKGTLIITIKEVNYLTPEFLLPWTLENPKYSVELQEEQPIGTVIDTFRATDKDNSIAAFTIEPESPYFYINKITGIVQTSQVIDYEETKHFNFIVVVYDTGIPQQSSSAKVIVTVLNINDENPKFENEFYNVMIKENSLPGTRVIIVNAVDADEGQFGEVTYRLIGEYASDFNIGFETGEITVGNSTLLDREIIPEITISVVASDNAPFNSRRTTSIPVMIKLIDVNDNQPIFTQHSYHASVAENLSLKPPAPILQVRAIDHDEGIYGKVWYKIIKGNENGYFSLESETGILYPAISLLDRAQFYELQVEGRDMAGKGSYFDICNIYVKVISVNQYKPEFIIPELPNTTVEIPENGTEQNYLVMTVRAFDRDSSDNGKISYYFKVGNKNIQETEEFSINQETGELHSKIILDREVQKKFELVLVAADHGSPTAHETLRLLTIILIDVNDSVPEFFEQYYFNVPENRLIDYYVGKVIAEDKDEGWNAVIYYYIKSGNTDQAFTIDKSDGSIYTNQSFDREKLDSYTLNILAANDPNLYVDSIDDQLRNKHLEYGYVNVSIKILDENDNPPTFEKNIYFAGVNSMANLNDLIIKVKAVDADLGNNGTLQYYVSNAELYKYESIKSSGSIVPCPFNITQDGKLITSGYMAEYNQDRFIIEIVAKEVTSPERFAVTKIYVWIFEPSQLIKIILSIPLGEVNQKKDEIISELSNASQSRIIIVDIRYHINSTGYIRREWCDIYLHVVDLESLTISPIQQVLKIFDSKYDFLKDYSYGFAIQNVIPAYINIQEESINMALVTLITLIIVLFNGAITITVVCCCLRYRIINVPNDIQKRDRLIKKQIFDEINTTENPLWMEQKLKLYEEQELTMQVFSEPEGALRIEQREINLNLIIDDTSQDNTYATIKHSLQSKRQHISTPDCTTLSRNYIIGLYAKEKQFS